MEKLPVWDIPTRLFHWLLVVGIIAAVGSGLVGGDWIAWHGRSGLFVFGLLIFRIVWGFVGSSTARFARFVRGPAAIRAHLRGQWQGVGHNPLGALSVLALLGLGLAQVLTGLFANDDIAFQGPLAFLVDQEASDRARALHVLIFYALSATVVLHLLAIFYYQRIKGESLLKPMLTGWRERSGRAQADGESPTLISGRRLVLAFAFAALLAAISVAGVGGFLFPAATVVPAAVAAPAW